MHRQKTQARWRRRNPGYAIAYRIDQRSAQTEPPAVLRVPAPLNQLPWEFAKDAGRKPRLRPEQLEQLDQALREGARVHGFPADLWTLPRVAKVIERLTGHPLSSRSCMENSQDHALDLTKAGYPSTGMQSAEGEPLAEGNLASSKKKARRQKAWIFFQDESGVSQRPSIRRTWAPRGETPVLVQAFNWKKMSLIGFLQDLRREVRGRKVILVWDGLPAHKSRVMQEYLWQQRKWLTVEALPGYSPKLNPVENLWGNMGSGDQWNGKPEGLRTM